MKNLQNNFTTPEQSKRLLELGLPADSADCIIASYDGQMKRSILPTNMPTFGHFMKAVGNTPAIWAINQNEIYIPCWSVGRLIEIYRLYCVNTKEKWYLYSKSDERTLIEWIIDGITSSEMNFSKFEE